MNGTNTPNVLSTAEGGIFCFLLASASSRSAASLSLCFALSHRYLGNCRSNRRMALSRLCGRNGMMSAYLESCQDESIAVQIRER